MPAKRPAAFGTLAYLAECGRTVYVVCNRCGRFVVAHLQEIAERASWRARVDDVNRRLRCRECRFRDGKLTTDRPRAGQRVCPRCMRPYGSSILVLDDAGP